MSDQPFPIKAIRKLNQVVRGMTDQRSVQALRSIEREIQESLLPAATGLATAISEFAPHLASQTPLRIAIVSYEAMDGMDHCRWYQLAASLLARNEPFELDFVAYGPPLHDDELSSPGDRLLSHLPPARFFRCPVSQYVAERGAPDAVYACHLSPISSPNDLEHLSWIPSLLEEGTTIVGWSFNELERDLLCKGLEANGWGASRYATCGVYGTVSPPRLYSFNIGRYIWHLPPNAGDPMEVRHGALSSLADLADKHARAMHLGISHPWCGRVMPIPGFPEGVAFSVDDLAASLADGKRLRVVSQPGATSPTVEIVGDAERWEPISLAQASAVGPVGVARIVGKAFASYLFPSGMSLDSVFSEDAIQSLAEGMAPDEADALKKMAAMMSAKTGVDLGDPVFIAAHSNDAGAIQTLARAGADIHSRDKSGRTPLITAVSENAVDAVEALLDLGVDPDALLGFNRMTPAQVALSHGAMDSLALLLRRGAQIDAVTPFGTNPLREFLEAGQGGAALQAWYRDGLISGRVPPAPTLSDLDVDDDDSELFAEDGPGDTLLEREVTEGKPWVIDNIGPIELGLCKGAVPRVVLSRMPSLNQGQDESPDRVWEMEIELRVGGQRAAHCRIYLIECVDVPYGFGTIDDAEDWTSTLYQDGIDLAPQVADAWETDELVTGWIARVVEMNLGGPDFAEAHHVDALAGCLVISAEVASQLIGQNPHFALDDCPSPELSATPNAPERLARRRIVELLGGIRANPVDHTMFDDTGDEDGRVCHQHPFVYVLPMSRFHRR